MQFRTRVWSAGRLLAITACLVATYLLFAITAMRVALKVREVPVPELVADLPNAPQVQHYDQHGWLPDEVAWYKDLIEDQTDDRR